MKRKSHLIHPVFPAPVLRRVTGIALVIVLGFLVLISALILAFFSSVQTELVSAKSYAAGSSVKHLSDTASAVVLSQISDATKSFEVSGSPGSGKRLTWASQPGLIHTYDDDGKPNKTFKLYSSGNMVDASGDEYLASKKLNTEVPVDWATQPARFTDLNAPVLVPDETNGTLTGGNGKKYFASYPILDPDAKADGYTPGPAPGYAFSTLPTDKPSANKVAMPVAWLYVLQNGTITSASEISGDGLTADWSDLDETSPNRPSAENPIVGRVAFWTDDETSKININTASEPTPWDVPRAFTIQDLNYGRYQPANQEYPRYSGHPATVALSPVLFPGVKKLTKDQKKALYGILPRVEFGGTEGGTKEVKITNKVPIDSDRLFASMDEFIFSQSRSTQAVPVDSSSLFFLTATSRAPEVNLYGLPRIALWPLATNPSLHTAYDKLAAFCATLGDSSPTAPPADRFPFHFQRKDSTSATADWTGIPRNQALYTYLQNLTSRNVPGFGGNFLAKLQDRDGNDRDQVLTQIFDYIRCTNLRDPQRRNTGGYYAENGQVTPIVISETKGFGRFHTISQFGFHFICGQEGDKGALAKKKVPEKLQSGERMVEAAFLFEPFSPSMGFYKLAEDMFFEVKFNGMWTLDGQDLRFPTAAIGKPLNNRIGQGYHNNGREHGGTGGIRGPVAGFGGNDYPFVSTPIATQVATPSRRIIVGKGGNQITSMVFSGGTVDVKVYAGGTATPSKLIQTFRLNFPGGTLPLPDLVTDGTKQYRGGGATSAEHWWSFKEFDSGSGGKIGGRYKDILNVPHAPGIEYARPERRWDFQDGEPGFKVGGMFRVEDVVRTVVPDHGDMRLVATTVSNVSQPGPSQFVKVDEDRWSGDTRFLHIFSNASGPHFHFGFSNEPTPDDKSPATLYKGKGVIPPVSRTDQLTGSADVFYHYSRLPEIRSGAGTLYNKWGDFDNGPAQWMDGAYINKPDEGNTSVTNSAGGIEYPYWSWNDSTEVPDTFFSPNRMIPSAGMLGSLPTGAKRNQPWRTLLFRPQKNHPGNGSVESGLLSSFPPYAKPPDHLLLDLFWMPIIEPYAISEPFSTAGKINLNYEIAPFTYLRRTTALRGAFKGEEPLLIPNAASKIYKLWDHETNDNGIMPDSSRNKDADVRTKWSQALRGQAPFDKMRRSIDVDETLKQADARFADTGIFRSPTQISELHLVRDGEKLSDYENDAMWKKTLLTGDNTRERPYTNLLGKLTTKSNSFTIHMRVQVLRKRASADQAKWVEGQDQIASEYRGSTLIERYIDVSAKLPDFAKAENLAGGSLDDYYKFRTVSSKKFAP